MTGTSRPRVCIFGPGTRFLSGLTVYTYRLANAVSRVAPVSVVLMRQLLPTRLYPGSSRVGDDLARLEFEPSVHVFDGVDWYWVPSIFRALRFLMSERPEVVIFQWWTGTVVHSYIVLALVARALGGRIVIEFHEVQDPGELAYPAARAYVRLVAPLLVRLAHGFTVHTEADQSLLGQKYGIAGRPIAVLPHGPHDHYQAVDSGEEHARSADSACNLLFFGLIRPYKGLQDLVTVFDSIPPDQIGRFHLTVVGETWEGWTRPTELIQSSRYRDRITFVNRYVSDNEVGKYFRTADAVVLPYHRACISGPLHVAMGYGLPVVVTRVGGLVETVEGYEGAILIPPEDQDALRAALFHVAELADKRFAHPYTWEDTAAAYERFFPLLLHTHAAREGVLGEGEKQPSPTSTR
ncbi:MAG: glycosyltransferase [Chloroflexota bacterium]|nr:MAG: glycosyl transferase [Chloroflexota bacterium]